MSIANSSTIANSSSIANSSFLKGLEIETFQHGHLIICSENRRLVYDRDH